MHCNCHLAVNRIIDELLEKLPRYFGALLADIDDVGCSALSSSTTPRSDDWPCFYVDGGHTPTEAEWCQWSDYLIKKSGQAICSRAAT